MDNKVKGRIEIRNDELDDLVIARPDGTPTYNFCVVVDNIDMDITHVIRGDNHVNNTPRQINIFEALDVLYSFSIARVRIDGLEKRKSLSASFSVSSPAICQEPLD